MATVNSPPALRASVNENLGKARQSIQKLQEAELPEFNRHQPPKQSIVDFLEAAYGIVPVIETFAGQRGQRRDFDDWRTSWEAQQLNDEERALWLQMLDEQVTQEQGQRHGLIPVLIPITRGQMSVGCTDHSVPSEPRQFKDGVRFLAYPTRQASDVCLQYLELCERFWRAFESAQLWPKTG